MPFFCTVMTMSLVGLKPLEGGRGAGVAVAPGLSALNNEFLWQLKGNRSALCMEAEYRDSAMSVSERTVCSWRYAGVIIA